MKLYIKQKIEKCRQELEISDSPSQKAELESLIKGLTDCANDLHVFTEIHYKEEDIWKSSYRCHYCQMEKA